MRRLAYADDTPRAIPPSPRALLHGLGFWDEPSFGIADVTLIEDSTA
jgi:hypothetical protein